MRKLLNNEEEIFILNNLKGKSSQELVDLIKINFNKELTVKQIKRWKENRGLKSNTLKLFNEEETDFIYKNYKNRTTEQLTKLFNEKFNRNVTQEQILHFKSHNKLKSGVSFKFESGQTPHNFKPIGSEFVNYENGIKITYIKVGNPNTWEKKQVYLYKKYKGDIPKGNIITFLDGNRDNFDLDNLIMLTRNEHNTISGNYLYYKNKELNKTGILIGKLMCKTNEIKKEKKI